MDKIHLKHPAGKKRSSIDKIKYQAIKQVILSSLRDGEMLTYSEMTRLVKDKLGEKFGSALEWDVEAVKLDLEARQVLKRVKATKPDRYRKIGTC